MTAIIPVSPDEAMGIESGPDQMYPMGTRLQFEGDLAKALGVDNLRAGDIIEVRGIAFVEERSEESDGAGTIEKELCLQLTDVNLRKQVSAVELMYPPKE